MLTGDTFLVDMATDIGDNMPDAAQAAKTNELGAALMILRDRLKSKEWKEGTWSEWLHNVLDTGACGRPYEDTYANWRALVREARRALQQSVASGGLSAIRGVEGAGAHAHRASAPADTQDTRQARPARSRANVSATAADNAKAQAGSPSPGSPPLAEPAHGTGSGYSGGGVLMLLALFGSIASVLCFALCWGRLR